MGIEQSSYGEVQKKSLQLAVKPKEIKSAADWTWRKQSALASIKMAEKYIANQVLALNKKYTNMNEATLPKYQKELEAIEAKNKKVLEYKKTIMATINAIETKGKAAGDYKSEDGMYPPDEMTVLNGTISEMNAFLGIAQTPVRPASPKQPESPWEEPITKPKGPVRV